MNKKEKPKVSVIIPVYNVEEYLRECLNSVINQTLKDIEIILIDDESTDSSKEICDEYALKDKRITVIHQKNKGIGTARNIGIDIAKGEYIDFVDADDYLKNNALELVYNFAQKNKAEVVQFNYNVLNLQKTESHIDIFKNLNSFCNHNLNKKHYFAYKDIKPSVFINSDLHVWIRLYSKDFIKKFNLRFLETKYAEDHFFVICVLLNAQKIYCLDEYLYVYRKRKNSATDTISNNHFCIFEVSDMIKKYLKTENLYKDLKRDFIIYQKCAFIWHFNNIPGKQKIKYIIKCFLRLSILNFIKLLIIGLKQKLIYLVYIILVKLGIKDSVKKILQKCGYKFDE